MEPNQEPFQLAAQELTDHAACLHLVSAEAVCGNDKDGHVRIVFRLGSTNEHLTGVLRVVDKHRVALEHRRAHADNPAASTIVGYHTAKGIAELLKYRQRS